MENLNLKIGEGTPFSYQISKRDTVGELIKSLYATNHRVVGAQMLVRTITNTLIPIDKTHYQNHSVLDVLHKQNGIAIQFRLSEELRLPSVDAPGTVGTEKELKVGGSQDPPLVVPPPGQIIKFTTPTVENQIRLSDLSMKDLNELLYVNKISYGRIVDEDNKVQTCSRELFRYTIKPQQNTQSILENVTNSYVRTVDNLSVLDKELIKEGITPIDLSLKVPFISALSFQYEKKLTRTITDKSKTKYNCKIHYLPVGEIRLDLVDREEYDVELNEKFKSYFNTEENFSCSKIQDFYRTYGQFFITRIVLGLKHISENHKASNTFNDKSVTNEKIGGTFEATYKGFGPKLKGSHQDIITDTKNTNTDNEVDQVTMVGGTNAKLFSVEKLSQSILNWRLWRIIEVKDYWPIDIFLDEKVRGRIRYQLGRHNYMHQLWIGETMFRELGVLDSPAGRIEAWSPSRAVSTFNSDIFQIVPVMGQCLLMVQKKRIDLIYVDNNQPCQIPVKNVENLTKINEVIGCAIDQASNILYVAQKNRIHVFTLPNLAQQPSMAISTTPRVSIYRYDCFVREGVMLGCGEKGLFYLDVRTGMHEKVATGNFSKCEIVRMQNRVYLFGENVTCVDFVSRCSAVIENHQWSPGQPTTNGFEVWKCSNKRLFRIRGAKVDQTTYTNGTINTSRFAKNAPVCFMKGSLFLPDQSASYLIQYPFKNEKIDIMERAKLELSKRDIQGQPEKIGSSYGPTKTLGTSPSQSLPRPQYNRGNLDFRSKEMLSPRTKATFNSFNILQF